MCIYIFNGRDRSQTMYKIQNTKCKTKNAKYKVQLYIYSMGDRSQSMNKIQNAKNKVQNIKYKMQNTIVYIFNGR